MAQVERSSSQEKSDWKSFLKKAAIVLVAAGVGIGVLASL